MIGFFSSMPAKLTVKSGLPMGVIGLPRRARRRVVSRMARRNDAAAAAPRSALFQWLGGGHLFPAKRGGLPPDRSVLRASGRFRAGRQGHRRRAAHEYRTRKASRDRYPS